MHIVVPIDNNFLSYHDAKAPLGRPYLYVEEPWPKVVNALVLLLHVPDNKVESVAREKTLVSGIVDLLTSHVPDTELNLNVVLEGGGGGGTG